MELRQLRSFVAVADELHFGRAAERLYISGPAMSQQIIALERDVGVQLFVRDRRGVQLTAAGHSLVRDAREILSMVEAARGRLRQATALGSPLRLGYVSWLPGDIAALVGPTIAVRVDEWVLPSHAQADRVAEGTLDLAIAWVTSADAEQRGLCAELLYAEPLHALLPGSSSSGPIAAAEVIALVDADESAWSSWNRFVEEYSVDTGARIARIADGGIIGEAFFGYVRRAGAAVLSSPKRHTAPTPPTLGQRPVDPTPLWTWSMLRRRDDDRPAVRQVVDSLRQRAESMRWTAPVASAWWAPLDDPHRAVLERNKPLEDS